MRVGIVIPTYIPKSSSVGGCFECGGTCKTRFCKSLISLQRSELQKIQEVTFSLAERQSTQRGYMMSSIA